MQKYRLKNFKSLKIIVDVSIRRPFSCVGFEPIELHLYFKKNSMV
jgi:hypothetical protein